MTQNLTVIELIEDAAEQLEDAGLSLANGFGQGTLNAFDEAAWLVLWALKLPLDDLDGVANRPVDQQNRAQVASYFIAPTLPAGLDLAAGLEVTQVAGEQNLIVTGHITQAMEALLVAQVRGAKKQDQVST